jgi:hypothetical protein
MTCFARGANQDECPSVQSALDNAYTWFFEEAIFKGGLEIVLLEGIRNKV